MVIFSIGLILSFCLGAMPTSYLVARWVAKIDIRQHGSGNVGATNVNRTLGSKWGLTVLAIDMLKGALPAWIGPIVFSQGDLPVEVQAALYGAAAIVGHIWTPFLKFKGGKGVATSTGAFLVLAPLAMGTSALIFVVCVALTRFISLGSVLGAMSLPLWVYLFGYPKIVLITAMVLSVLVVHKHKANLRRLALGEESRFSFRK